MISRFRSRPGFTLILLTQTVPALLAGCGDRPGDLAPVNGTLTVNGAPLRTGSVTFHPDADRGNPTRHLPSGTINEQGVYDVATAGRKGAPPGWYRVTVSALDNPTWQGGQPSMPRSLIDPRYRNPQTTDLVIEVREAAKPGAYDLKLKK